MFGNLKSVKSDNVPFLCLFEVYYQSSHSSPHTNIHTSTNTHTHMKLYSTHVISLIWKQPCPNQTAKEACQKCACRHLIYHPFCSVLKLQQNEKIKLKWKTEFSFPVMSRDQKQHSCLHRIEFRHRSSFSDSEASLYERVVRRCKYRFIWPQPLQSYPVMSKVLLLLLFVSQTNKTTWSKM